MGNCVCIIYGCALHDLLAGSTHGARSVAPYSTVVHTTLYLRHITINHTALHHTKLHHITYNCITIFYHTSNRISSHHIISLHIAAYYGVLQVRLKLRGNLNTLNKMMYNLAMYAYQLPRFKTEISS